MVNDKKRARRLFSASEGIKVQTRRQGRLAIDGTGQARRSGIPIRASLTIRAVVNVEVKPSITTRGRSLSEKRRPHRPAFPVLPIPWFALSSGNDRPCTGRPSSRRYRRPGRRAARSASRRSWRDAGARPSRRATSAACRLSSCTCRPCCSPTARSAPASGW